MKSYVITLAGVLLLLFSCKKNDEILGPCSAPPIPSSYDYIPLKIGNYWIYDWFSFSNSDATGVFNIRDTLTVTGTEIINDQEYFKLERTANIRAAPVVYWRDSLGYLVDENGRVEFTAEHFGTVFEQDFVGPKENPIVIASYSVDEELVEVEVPAGTFYCLDKKGKFDYTNPENMQFKADHTFVAPGLGIVKGNFNFVSGEAFIEYRLVEYHLE